MDKELKIVFSVFLVYFIYALSSFFNQGVFLAPIILTRFAIALVALILVLNNLKQVKVYLLILYLLCTLLLICTDTFSVGYLDMKFGVNFFTTISNSFSFILFSFIFYFGFLFYSIVHFHLESRNFLLSSILCSIIACLIFLFFTDYYLAKEILIHLFFLCYFAIIQNTSSNISKAVRLLSYQYLLLFLLESFEYFV